jgi:hypothetical protein
MVFAYEVYFPAYNVVGEQSENLLQMLGFELQLWLENGSLLDQSIHRNFEGLPLRCIKRSVGLASNDEETRDWLKGWILTISTLTRMLFSLRIVLIMRSFW